MTKRQARTVARALRDDLDAAYRARASERICRALAAVYDELPQAHPMVASYAPMGSEVDITAFSAYMRARGGQLALPLVLKQMADGQRMQMRKIPESASVQPPFAAHPARAFDPTDPALAAYPPIEPSALDLIVVPLLGFDARGMRLGYGGGCYDRYLPELAPACRIVGVAFAAQELPHVPYDAYDIVLPRILTERDF